MKPSKIHSVAFSALTFIAIHTTSANAASDTLSLSLRQAMDTARTAAVSVQIAHSKSVEMDQRVGESRGALLPHIGATATDFVRSVDLPAQGFSADALGFGGGATFPSLIKPFNAQDARVNASLSLVDISAWKRYEASKNDKEGSEWEEQAASEDAAMRAAASYLILARARALVTARQSELAMAQDLAELTRAQKQAGATTRIEVLRAEGQLSSSQSALAAAMGEEEQARYALLRVLGMDMGVYPALTDTLSLGDENSSGAPDANVLSSSVASRPEIMAASKKADAARSELSALNANLFPTLNLAGDYGLIGRRLNGNAEWTEDIVVQLNWNLWDGGQREAKRSVQHERLRQAEISQRDVKDEVELEVRNSLSSMHSSHEQAAHALDRVKFSEEEARLAEDRFRSGASGNLEVITAQTSMSLAHDGYVDALYQYNHARLAFLRAAHRLSEL